LEITTKAIDQRRLFFEQNNDKSITKSRLKDSERHLRRIQSRFVILSFSERPLHKQGFCSLAPTVGALGEEKAHEMREFYRYK